MATVKIKFRPSKLDRKEGAVYYQISHRRAVRMVRTPYKLFPMEWDERTAQVVLPRAVNARQRYLSSLADNIRRDIGCLKELIAYFERRHLP